MCSSRPGVEEVSGSYRPWGADQAPPGSCKRDKDLQRCEKSQKIRRKWENKVVKGRQ